MKIWLSGLLLLLFLNGMHAQNVGINEDGSSPHSGALLDIKSSDKGLLIPRTRTTSIVNPSDGMIVYDTIMERFAMYEDSQWLQLVREDDVIFERNGPLIRQNDNYDTDDFLIGRAALPSSIVISDTLFFFDKSKAALRAGQVSNSNDWAPDSIGHSSFASGSNTVASGFGAIASGNESKARGANSIALGSSTQATGLSANAQGNLTTASGDYSTALGRFTRATGDYSFSIGFNNIAAGRYATVMGQNNSAPSAYETTIGRFSTIYSPATATGWNTNDRLFTIGNGTGVTELNDAFSILKNGNTTISGNLTLTDGADAYTLPNTDGNDGQALTTDGNGNLNWTNGNDLGVFERNGSLVRQRGNASTDNFIIGSADGTASLPNPDQFFYFHKSTGAFIGGSFTSNLSFPSYGMGAFTYGQENGASGNFSASFGGENFANGNYSFTAGKYVIAASAYETAIGYYSQNYSPGSTTSWVASDRIFTIGNGSSISSKSNAMVVLKNGKTGIGNSNPSSRLMIDAAAAEDPLNVRVNGTTKMMVHDNGGIAIGQGTSTPPSDGAILGGRVGIKNTNPQSALQINADVGEDAFRIISNSSTRFMVHDNYGVGIGYSTTTPPASGLIVSGQVGIGKSVPNSELHIRAGSSAGLIQAETSAETKFMVHNNGGVGIGFGAAIPPDDALIVDGRLGLGTTSPDATLEIIPSGSEKLLRAEDFIMHNSGSVSIGYNSTEPPNEGMIIDGRVGVNTMSPQAHLHIGGTTSLPDLFFEEVGAFANGDITWEPDQILSLGTWDSGASTYSPKLKINGDGKMGLNTGSAFQATFHIKQLSGEDALLLENDQNTNLWGWRIGIADLALDFNGGLVAYIDDADGSYNTSSDRSLKKDISYLEENILGKVLQLKPSTYRFKKAAEQSPKTLGFIAQEVQELFPEIVKTAESGNLALHYPDFGILSIKAIQELNDKVDSQEEVIKMLLERIETLEKK